MEKSGGNAQGKTKAVARPRAPSGQKTPQAVSLDGLRPRIHAEITSHAVEMVQAMIGCAKEGQYQAMKYLFEMIGLYPAKADEEAAQSEQLAQFLLSRLGISQEVTQSGRGGKAVSVAGDAVK